MAASALPRQIHRYQILSELGRGSMGVVYLARDPNIDRRIALKVLATHQLQAAEEADELRRRFLQEARAAGGLNHPAIVTVYDADSEPATGDLYLAMEWIAGRSLKELLRTGGPLAVERAVDLAARVARALDYAHRRDVVHRDVKPANLLVTADGEVKVVDFGIAKLVSKSATQPGRLLGSPYYMAPEQVRGLEVDGRCDLFALGAVLYECLTGRVAFGGESLSSVSYKILSVDPRPIELYTDRVPPSLQAVVDRALAKLPQNRFQSGAELAAALETVSAELVLGASGTVRASAGRPASGPAETATAPLAARDSDLLEAGPAALPRARRGRLRGLRTAALAAVLVIVGVVAGRSIEPWWLGFEWLGPVEVVEPVAEEPGVALGRPPGSEVPQAPFSEELAEESAFESEPSPEGPWEEPFAPPPALREAPSRPGEGEGSPESWTPRETPREDVPVPASPRDEGVDEAGGTSSIHLPEAGGTLDGTSEDASKIRVPEAGGTSEGTSEEGTGGTSESNSEDTSGSKVSEAGGTSEGSLPEAGGTSEDASKIRAPEAGGTSEDASKIRAPEAGGTSEDASKIRAPEAGGTSEAPEAGGTSEAESETEKAAGTVANAAPGPAKAAAPPPMTQLEIVHENRLKLAYLSVWVDGQRKLSVRLELKGLLSRLKGREHRWSIPVTAGKHSVEVHVSGISRDQEARKKVYRVFSTQGRDQLRVALRPGSSELGLLWENAQP